MLAERKASQPVWLRNAGCVFKNPKGSSAGLLIDRSGCKGMAAGNVEVSDVHANFMVTKGGITAAEVLKLIDRVRKQVRDREGVDLETEVRIVGEFGIEPHVGHKVQAKGLEVTLDGERRLNITSFQHLAPACE